MWFARVIMIIQVFVTRRMAIYLSTRVNGNIFCFPSGYCKYISAISHMLNCLIAIQSFM